MKKEFIISIILTSLFIIPLFASNTKALDYYNPQVPGEVLGQAAGVNVSLIPTTPEELQQRQDQYLKKEWNLIISNSTIYGPIHRFLMNHQIISLTLFGMGYEFSLTFFFMLVLWAVALYILVRVVRTMDIGKNFILALILGLAGTIALAQTRLFQFLAKTGIDLAFNQSAWWARILIWIGLIVFVFLEVVIGKQIVSYLRARKRKMRAEDVKHSEDIIKATAKPIVKARQEFSNEDGESIV